MRKFKRWYHNVKAMFSYYWTTDRKSVKRWGLQVFIIVLLLAATEYFIINDMIGYLELQTATLMLILWGLIFVPLASINGNVKKYLNQTKE